MSSKVRENAKPRKQNFRYKVVPNVIKGYLVLRAK